MSNRVACLYVVHFYKVNFPNQLFAEPGIAIQPSMDDVQKFAAEVTKKRHPGAYNITLHVSPLEAQTCVDLAESLTFYAKEVLGENNA